MTIHKLDPAAECKTNGKNQELLAILRKTYKTEQEVQFRMSQIMTVSEDMDQGEEMGFYQVMTDPKYYKASWVAALTMMFQQFSGINAIMSYAGQIFSSLGSMSSF
jgi:hypothetical protein